MKNCAFVCLVVIGLAVGCSGTDSPTLEATPASFNAAGGPTVEFSVPDMMCPDGCGETVREILAKQPGAEDVLIDFEGKRAVVAVDEGEFDADRALAALVDKQFGSSSLKDESAAKPQAAAAPVQ